MPISTARIASEVPAETIDWLLEPDNPAVAVLTRRGLLGEADDAATAALWERRNDYAPVAAILAAQLDNGSWTTPGQDYKKYQGSLWQVHLLGELHASGDDPRVQKAAEYAFSRQLPDGSWSATNARPEGSIACLTSNVGRALARMGWARDERLLAAVASIVDLFRELGIVDCRSGREYQLNGYCHMLTVKELLFLGEVPQELWPAGADALRDECIAKLRDKAIFRAVPAEAREFNDAIWSLKSSERTGLRERFLAEHPELHYKEKAGWLRFGFPLSYNSDALEALWALVRVGEKPQPEYEPALDLVRKTADKQMRWALKNTFNGKMLADVEAKGQPSKWLTLRALQVLEWASG
jgi:hypothetical protein